MTEIDDNKEYIEIAKLEEWCTKNVLTRKYAYKGNNSPLLDAYDLVDYAKSHAVKLPEVSDKPDGYVVCKGKFFMSFGFDYESAAAYALDPGDGLVDYDEEEELAEMLKEEGMQIRPVKLVFTDTPPQEGEDE